MTSRTVLITGANRGLGLAIAEEMHEYGHKVIIAGRDYRKAAAVADRLGGAARALALDVTDPCSVDRAAETLNTVEILVNNAGVMTSKGHSPASVPLELVEQEIQVNVLGAWRISQACLPAMLERGWGRIVMLSSGTSTFTFGLFGGTPGYTVSKVGLNSLTSLLADETTGGGVLVNAANPGMVRTDMVPDAERSPAEAAADIAWVATLPDDGPSGVLFSRRKIIGW